VSSFFLCADVLWSEMEVAPLIEVTLL
jgi:hypothetical protein